MPIYFGSQLIGELRVGTQLYDGYVGSQMVHGKTVDPVFANNDWATIAAACHSGEVPDTWAVGDQKAMTIGGGSYLIDIIGKNCDTYTGGGTAPLTFQLHDCVGTARMNASNTNVGGFRTSEMYNTLNSNYLNQMPSEVIAAIKSVNKLCNVGGGSYTIETVPCKLFLLSEVEVSNGTDYSVAGQGTQYQYYATGGLNSRRKYLNGTLTTWWCRSPWYPYNTGFNCFATNGYCTSNDPIKANAVAFAFCF